MNKTFAYGLIQTYATRSAVQNVFGPDDFAADLAKAEAWTRVGMS